jgi:hypothetical protein
MASTKKGDPMGAAASILQTLKIGQIVLGRAREMEMLPETHRPGSFSPVAESE